MKSLFILVFFLFLVIIYSCSDNSVEPSNELTVKPIVLKTTTNYNEQVFNSKFPQNDILKNISEAYKTNYTENIKKNLIEYVKAEVESLGENNITFWECFELTGCQTPNSISLPSYIEKAKFNGEDTWIIQLSWGIKPSDLGHFKCFAIRISSRDTLYYT